MKKLILILSYSFIVSCFGAITNQTEIIKTCSKCNGSGTMRIFVTCEACKGKGMLSRLSYSNLHNRTYVNSHVRCSACSMSAKLGQISKNTQCDRCGGTGKIKTGKFRKEIVYTNDVCKMRNKSNTVKESIKDRNQRLIRQQKILDDNHYAEKVAFAKSCLKRKSEIGKYPCTECRNVFKAKGYWKIHCKECNPQNK